jgi:hypothetical protein
MAVCDHDGLVKVLAQPAPDIGPILMCVPVQPFRAYR